MSDVMLYTIIATLFTFGCTVFGSAFVFLYKKQPSVLYTKASLGFAAGIMIAASVWSLLIPAIEQAESLNVNPTMASALGFILGVLFLILMDKLTPHLHIGSKDPEGPKTKLSRTYLLCFAVTIHNIPEGMAVGIAFVAAGASSSPELFSAAIALALGMGIQNIPEGTAVALPLQASGMGKFKAFALGSLSAIVEPIAAIIVVLLSGYLIPAMPYLLSFAAGAMMYVVVEELIPEAKLGEHSDLGTIFVLLGFVLMMVLDTALG